MNVQDGLVDLVDVVDDGPEEVSQEGRGTGVAQEDDGAVLVRSEVVEGLLGPLDALLMADVPLGLVGDGAVDEVETDEEDAVVEEGEVLLPSQLGASTGSGNGRKRKTSSKRAATSLAPRRWYRAASSTATSPASALTFCPTSTNAKIGGVKPRCGNSGSGVPI